MNWIKILMWLVYGAIIGVPLTAVNLAIAPFFSSHAFLTAVHYLISFVLLGLWARFVVKNIHILGG